MSRLVLTLSCLMYVVACAPRDAGFAAVKTTVRERIGQEPRYRDVEAADGEDPVTARQIAAWLAKPLDADTAVRIALLQNPQLQAAFTRLGVARASLVSASVLPNPELHGELGFPEGGGPAHITFGATASLTRLIALPLRRSEASAGLAAAQTRAAADALDVAFRTRQAFYECQAAEQELVLVREVIVASRLTAELVARLHEAGNVTDLELAQARAFEESAQLTAADAELRAVERRTVLWEWLGGAASPGTLRIEPNLPAVTAALPALAELEQEALAQSLDLAWLRAEDARLERAKTSSTWTGGLPDLRAGVHFERDHGEWEVGPTASLSLPLFDRGQGAHGIAAAAQRGLYYERRARTLSVRAASASLRARLEVAMNRVQRYHEQLLPLRKKIVDETLLQYNAMQIGVAQLLMARTSELESRREHVAALRSYWLLRSELDQLLAGRLMDESTRTGEAVPTSSGVQADADGGGGH